MSVHIWICSAIVSFIHHDLFMIVVLHVCVIYICFTLIHYLITLTNCEDIMCILCMCIYIYSRTPINVYLWIIMMGLVILHLPALMEINNI